jgi:hypothetical protein
MIFNHGYIEPKDNEPRRGFLSPDYQDMFRLIEIMLGLSKTPMGFSAYHPLSHD